MGTLSIYRNVNQAQVFFVLTIVLFLIVVSVAVIFGGVLAQETVSQKAKIESAKADMLISSVLTDAIVQVQKNPEGAIIKAMNLSQGQASYTIASINATTTIINTVASIGRITKRALIQVIFDSDKIIQSVKISY